MKLITIAGPPSSGKTSVLLQVIEQLVLEGIKVGVVKFDCLTSFDQLRYEEHHIPIQVGYSGKVCPDHYFISNVEEAVLWGYSQGFDVRVPGFAIAVPRI